MSRHFYYKAIDKQGRFHNDHIITNNEVELESRLNNMGLDLVRFKERKNTLWRFNASRFSRHELINFTFQMQQLHESGVSILDSLQDLKDSTQNRDTKNTLTSITELIQGGKTLSQALAEFPHIFKPVYVSLIKVGEETGKLDVVMQSMAENLKWQDELISHSKKILIYPLIVLIVIFSVLAYLMIFLVPQLVPFIQDLGGTIPAHTQALIYTSAFLKNYYDLLLIIPLILFIMLKVSIRYCSNIAYFIDGVKLRTYLIGPIILKSHLARFSNYFALMYASGINIIESLKIAESLMGNAVLTRSIAEIREQIIQGKTLSESFHSYTIYPPLVIRMLKVGETTGALDKSLLNISYFYNREVKESIDKMEAGITPLLSIIMGVILLWIISAVLGPIYDSLAIIN